MAEKGHFTFFIFTGFVYSFEVNPLFCGFDSLITYYFNMKCGFNQSVKILCSIS